jgi:hypothetical protein
MPITLNHSNIGVQYNTGSNYIIETVKSDLYLRDIRTDITSNLLAEPTVISPVFTETVRSFIHSGGTEAQTPYDITIPQNTICDILIVGGGGGGSHNHGGGGGGGAVVFINSVVLNSGSYTIKVGAGGAKGTRSTTNFGGLKGNDTIITLNGIDILKAEGGGGGGQGNATGSIGNGGSGGGGDGYRDGLSVFNNGVVGTGSIKDYNGTIGVLYGNNGGSYYLATSGAYLNKAGAGGGGGGAGQIGSNATKVNVGGNGGNGISSAIINSNTYNFAVIFGTTYGTNDDNNNTTRYFGGGGGGSIWGNPGGDAPAGDIGGTIISGSGGKGGGGAGALQAATTGFNGSANTGGGGGGGSYNTIDSSVDGGNGGSGIVIIRFKTIVNAAIPEGNPITHKTLNFTYDLTKYAEYLAQQKTGVGGWRIVRFLPPTATNWYQGDYINTSTFNIPTIGTPYNYTNEWAVSFGTFDEMFFGTFNMNYWLRCLKTSVLGTYSNTARPIISSSFSSTPYNAIWYNRGTGEDPLISIQNYPTQVVYREQLGGDLGLISIDGGMCVLVRDSTASTTIPNPNQYTLNFPVPTIADINNNSNIVLRGAYDISLSTTNSSIIPKSGQYIIPPTTFSTPTISIRYNLLNPTLDPIGAQWTYNSSNTNVYHMGNVGIGTKSPEYNLDVRGAIYSSSGGYTQTGLTTWSIASDRRIKENIVKASYEKCLENVKNIELYNFNFKDDCVNTNDKHQLGFIAQEVQQVYPKAVEVGKMILNTNEKIDDLLSLNTTQIDYTLYGAVKNLIEKIEDIDNELGNIERNI